MSQIEALVNSEPTKDGKETILVVDDDEIVLDYAASLLTGANYHVMTAHGPELALYVAEHYQRPIHLLVTDYQMPDFSGVELAQVLLRNRPELCVLVMSGREREEVPLDPDWSFIQKPFRPDGLLNAVAKMLPRETSTPERMPVGRAVQNSATDKRKAS
jgi:two-component system cell cycle sensor histidine kinase/response regulator CckA